MKTLLYLLLTVVCLTGRGEDAKVLKSKIAGSWYTADPVQLRKEIAGYVKAAGEKKYKNVIALIMPHAGYRFSGKVAGYAIKEIMGGKYSRVIIIGPSHYNALGNQISIPDISAYQTPLGLIKLDTEFINELKKIPNVISRTYYHEREHSIQIELPLLQYALPGIKVVPLLIGRLNLVTTRKIAAALLALMDKDTLVVVSSDFTHYGRRFNYMPFGMNFQTMEKIRKLDLKAFDFFTKKDLPGFTKFIDETQATICGRCGIALLTAMLPEKAEAHLLKYSTSAETTGFNGESVSYVAAAVSGQWEPKAPETRKVVSMKILSPETRLKLLHLARKTIKFYLDKERIPDIKDLGITPTPDMDKPLGAFVTLHKNGNLRGCIGNYLRKGVPLYKVVEMMAKAAAFDDPRFRPLVKDELKDIDIEISVLTPPEAVKSWKDIVLDRDGIILKKEGRTAVFLPQVAPEQNWTMEETLSYLSRKAGLPWNAWREGAEFEVFQADVFGEKQEK